MISLPISCHPYFWFPPPSSLPLANTNLLSVYRFWTFQLDGITLYMVFYNWLLSLGIMFWRLIQVVTYIGISFLSPNDFPLYGRITFSFLIHWLMEICILFGFYKKEMLWSFMYTFLCVCMFSFLLDMNLYTSSFVEICFYFSWIDTSEWSYWVLWWLDV